MKTTIQKKVIKLGLLGILLSFFFFGFLKNTSIQLFVAPSPAFAACEYPYDMSWNCLGIEDTGTIPGGIGIEDTGTIPGSCFEFADTPYPQCGGTVGLEDKDPALTFMVTRVRDCRGNIIRYEKDNGRDLGQCAVAPQPTPSPVCQEITRSYPQCGGTVGLLDFPKTDTIWVTEITNTCTGAKDYWRIPPLNLGNRGECFVAPTPTPVVVFPTPTPVSPPVCIQVITNARNPFTGECRAFPTPCDVPSGWQVVASCFVPTPTPTVPVVTPVPPQGGVSQSCPNGTTFGGINGSNLICVQQVQNQVQNAIANANASTGPITVTVAGSTTPQIIERAVVTNPAPVVVKTIVAGDMVELPKTGLPIAAWALTGLAPLGFRLRRVGYSLKKSTSVAQYLWQQREWNRN